MIKAAERFDLELFQDYFDSSVSFYAQVRPFTESTRSGPASPRRVLSVASDIFIPSRRIIKMVSSGKIYVVGGENEDYWYDKVIRKEYPLIPADTQAVIGDVGAHLSGSGLSSDVFLFMSYVRRVPLEEESSLFFAGYEAYFSSVETIPNNNVIKFDEKYFRVKTPSSIDGAGFGLCEAVQLDNPVEVLDYTKKDAPYDPVTDSYDPTVVSDITVFIEPAQFNFLFVYPAFDRLRAGDKTISILKTTIPVAEAGDMVGTRKVVSVRDNGTYWSLHCR